MKPQVQRERMASGTGGFGDALEIDGQVCPVTKAWDLGSS